MQINRRDTLRAFLTGVAASSLPPIAAAFPVAKQAGQQSFTLSNGFRVHVLPNNSGYVAATLVLRSKEISHNGLAHICEHTSCAFGQRGWNRQAFGVFVGLGTSPEGT